ncbi:MAG: hypothetical protein KIT24_05090 [Phycisphaeraceae bacterium]|nr:hypothetical protein [Phycisphaeraceae bacterium]
MTLDQRHTDCERPCVLIDGITNAGAIPALEMTVRFTAQRQRLIAHNLANLSTPDFRPVDVSVQGFQHTLDRAIVARRERTGGAFGQLPWKPTRELQADSRGELFLAPRTPSDGVLFHDRNNRSVEREMQKLAENAGAHRLATELLRTRVDLLRSAIRETA